MRGDLLSLTRIPVACQHAGRRLFQQALFHVLGFRLQKADDPLASAPWRIFFGQGALILVGPAALVKGAEQGLHGALAYGASRLQWCLFRQGRVTEVSAQQIAGVGGEVKGKSALLQ